MQKLSCSARVNSASATTALSRSSFGSAVRASSLSLKYVKKSTAAMARGSVGSVAAIAIASDQVRKIGRSSAGTPSMCAITRIGTGALIASTASTGAVGSMASKASLVIRSTTGANPATRRTVKARLTMRRWVTCRGGSM